MPRKDTLVVVVALLLSACSDPASGGSTQAKLLSMPNLHCVATALQSADNTAPVSAVKTYRWRDQITYTWEYGGDLGATLEIEKTKSGIRYLNTNVRMGRDATRATQFYPVMRQVNAALSHRCNVTLRDVSFDAVG